MYLPPAFRDDDGARIVETIRAARIAQFITATAEGLIASPLPLFFDETEGERGVIYGHIAKANPQGRLTPVGEALAIFMGADAYVTPSWYETKRETGKVVPTWNYVAVHAYGQAEYFDDPARLLALVTRLTAIHEAERAAPWDVSDAPAGFIAAQLHGIVGIRLPVARLEAKRKLSQNRNEGDRDGVAAGLASSDRPSDRAIAALMANKPQTR